MEEELTLKSIATAIAVAHAKSGATYEDMARAAVKEILAKSAGWIEDHWYVVGADELEAIVAQPDDAQQCDDWPSCSCGRGGPDACA